MPKIISESNYRKYLLETAKHFGTTPELVEQDISSTIQQSWDDPDPEARAYQQQLFSGTHWPPTPREFVSVLGLLATDKDTHGKKQTP